MGELMPMDLLTIEGFETFCADLRQTLANAVADNGSLDMSCILFARNDVSRASPDVAQGRAFRHVQPFPFVAVDMVPAALSRLPEGLDYYARRLRELARATRSVGYVFCSEIEDRIVVFARHRALAGPCCWQAKILRLPSRIRRWEPGDVRAIDGRFTNLLEDR